jgi:apolipoprotein N-acyltransferase
MFLSTARVIAFGQSKTEHSWEKHVATYSPLKATLLWLFIVLIWIPGNRQPLDRQASVIRWTMFTFGVVLIWLGWRLPFAKAVWDILIVMAGSIIVLVFVYAPDLAYYLRQGCVRIIGTYDHTGED